MTTTSPPSNPYVDQLLDTIPKHKYYLIFLSSLERGRSWCRDCQNAEEPLGRNIPQGQGSVIYVGDRDTWNSESNIWRQAPFGIERVPTVLRLDPARDNGQDTDDNHLKVGRIAVADRLVEAEILDEKRLRKFVGKA